MNADRIVYGTAAASGALCGWASDLPVDDAARLRAAVGRYEAAERLLRPFTTWEKGVGYHAMMGDLQKQEQHAEEVLRPIKDHLAAAADEIEKALAGAV